MPKKKTIKSIRSGIFERGVSLTKLTLKSGALAASNSLSKFLGADSENNNYLAKQMKLIADELGQLKGSLMKAGQLLSTYGEHFLPPDAVEFLKSLQADSPPVEWPELEKVLLKNLGGEKVEQLEIETEPLAAASLGQVHRATVKQTGQQIVLKIQYPNLESVISSDLRAVRRLLSLANILPREGKYDLIFAEIKEMLTQELNYDLEAINLAKIGEILAGDERYIVPQPLLEFSSRQVLAMNDVSGLKVDSETVQSLPQDRRNRLGENYLELYFRELLEFGLMQTDPHLGNYSVKVNESGQDQLILLDYGAVREVPTEFLRKYHPMILGSLDHKRGHVIEGAKALGLLRDEDNPQLVQKFIELCYLFTEPFNGSPWTDTEGNYDFARSDLPKRVLEAGKSIVFSFRLRTPPNELVFLDRKLGGNFSFLAALKAKVNGRPLIEKYIYDPKLLRNNPI